MAFTKKGIRVLGIDDGAFEFEEDETWLTGVVYRGTEFIEDIVVTKVDVDGYDATERVIRLFDQCQNHGQIKAILLDGISFAGFNIVDIEEVSEDTGKPVVAVTANRPDRELFRETMERTGNIDERFENFGEPREVELKDGKVFVQYRGAEFEDVKGFVRASTIHGLSPEPIRVADMIGRAMAEGAD